MSENLATRDVIEQLSKEQVKSDRTERTEKRTQRPARKRVCSFCMEKDENKRCLYIDYKDPRLKKYITEKGKILPRHQTGLCSAHQRELATAIKKAKSIGLL
jgi:small subunit ribosomal protein S18